MANKRKRRRQRQRAATKREQGVVWKNYKVAARVSAVGGPVYVMNVKEYDEDKLFDLIVRYMKVENVDDFDILDIHHHRDDGKVEVLAEISESWPRGVAIITVKGEVMRGAGDEPFVLGAKAAAKKETAPVTSTTAAPSSVSEVAGTRITVLTIKPVLASKKAICV